MRSFYYGDLEQKINDHEVLELVTLIYETKRKVERLLEETNDLEELMERTYVQSVEASNKIEGITTTKDRLIGLVNDTIEPMNTNEASIIGYRDALTVINESYDVIPVTKNYILQIHKILFDHLNTPMKGRTKNVQNYISAVYPNGETKVLFTPLSPFETPTALELICEEYKKAIQELEVEPLILIPVFIHDFLCIHPFIDGNGRSSRLLTTLLLYQNGFKISKYISLEALIDQDVEKYYEVLNHASNQWYEGSEDVVPVIKYMLGIILKAYKMLEDYLMNC